ncbi:DUF1552 domain-containing protein [Sorangium sp. So ce388]|uniref:DUF1552 domain-containing protein n=1 Tax=Sorangium sp. So ce388 TaxID=3133309 RepID=UPI003F5B697A
MNKKIVTNLAHPHVAPRRGINRRAFLRAGGVAIALPFLEGLPSRSAWAADNAPVFSLYIVAACGVVGKKFFPDETGPLTTDGLAAMTDKATHVLAPHAKNLLFIRGINFPMGGPTNCGHAQGLCQSLTARPAQGGGRTASSGGVSADVVIAQLVNEGGADPLTLYAGNRKNGYIAERISFKGAGSGQVRSADDNPYTLYSKLVGLTSSGGGGGNQLAEELLRSRKSVNDFVGEELQSLMRMSALSSADKHRLQQHFDSIRDTEVTMGEMGSACSQAGLATSELEALEGGLAFKTDGMIEDVAKLHLELVALAFACNFNRVATLQHGDGTDQTKYAVPSNAQLNWPFHHISHRVQSDAQSGSNPTAEQAHAEIDVVRMQTLLHGLDQFKARDLFDKSIVMWTNHVSDGPSHSFRNVPTIIAGNGGGYLKQGEYIDAGGVTNNRLFNGLIAAAVRDKSEWTENFGDGEGSGPIDDMLA